LKTDCLVLGLSCDKAINVTKYQKMPAANMRFGASGGVTPLNVSCELGRLYPARPLVFPATAPSRRTIAVKELEKLAAATKQMIENRTYNIESFDRSLVQRLDVYSEQYVFDFLDFLLKAFPGANSDPLKEQLEKTIPYKAHTPSFIEEYDIRTFCGLSCYIPHPQRNDLNTYYLQLDWSNASGFYQFFK